MDAQNFCCWLRGFSELVVGQTPTPEQWKAIQEQLNLAFKKVTPTLQPARQRSAQEMMEEYLKLFPQQVGTGIQTILPGPVYC